MTACPNKRFREAGGDGKKTDIGISQNIGRPDTRMVEIFAIGTKIDTEIETEEGMTIDTEIETEEGMTIDTNRETEEETTTGTKTEIEEGTNEGAEEGRLILPFL